MTINSNMMMPRFQGSAIEVNGEWAWECLVTVLGAGDEGYSFSSNKTFKTKDEALIDLKAAVKKACVDFEKKVTGRKAEGKFLDLHSNKIRQWDGKDEH